MPEDLPSDIWIEIVENHLIDDELPELQQAIQQLSLTSKQLRGVAVPVLYRSLVFRVPIPAGRNEKSYVVAALIQHCTRAKHLLHSRDLLQHVRRLTLVNWNDEELSENYFSTADGPGMKYDAKKMMAVIYDTVTRLIRHMLGLRRLVFKNCRMTPFLRVTIPTFPLPTLPNLVEFSGGPLLLHAIAAGKNLEIININYLFHIDNAPITKFVTSSPIHLRELSLEGAANSTTPRELLEFIESFSVFPNLEYLVIHYNTPDIIWEGHVYLQVALKTIQDLTNRLQRLSICHIYTYEVNGYGLEVPPIGWQGIRPVRGHPCLEFIRVDFLSDFLWNWHPENAEGWRLLNIDDWFTAGKSDAIPL